MVNIKSIFWGIIVPIIVILAAGYVGQWYGMSIGCQKCQVGLPNLLSLEDLDKCFVCWMPSYCPVKESVESE